jgi:hypothetical protein
MYFLDKVVTLPEKPILPCAPSFVVRFYGAHSKEKNTRKTRCLPCALLRHTANNEFDVRFFAMHGKHMCVPCDFFRTLNYFSNIRHHLLALRGDDCFYP